MGKPLQKDICSCSTSLKRYFHLGNIWMYLVLYGIKLNLFSLILQFVYHFRATYSVVHIYFSEIFYLSNFETMR